MKPFISQHSYSNLVKTTKTYFLLLSGGIALFILIFLLQLLSYFSHSYSESSSSQIEIPHAATLVAAAATTTSGNNKNENKKDNKFVAVTTIAAPPADIEKPSGVEKPAEVEKVAELKAVVKSTVVLKAEKSFLKVNDEKNDEIIKELSQVIEMREFHFKHGSFSLKHQKGMERLDSSIQKCIEMPETWSKIVILGFTDNRGSKFVNVKLGLKRAQMLKSMLVKKGIPAEKITVASFGPELPIASNNTAAGRSINRRVEFNLLGAAGQ